MRRIQFYPNQELEYKLEEEARISGMSISALVNEKLNDLYFSRDDDDHPLSVLTVQVLKEIEEYIANPDNPSEFDILSASDTFRNIAMVSKKTPSTVRASIGRSFASKVATGEYANIQQLKKDGKLILSINNAIMYKVKR
jgi:hypothetical protein